LTTEPDHWHCAITLPLSDDDLEHFCTRFNLDALPTQADARLKAVEPILTAHRALGQASPYTSLAQIAEIFTRQQQPYLLIPGVGILAVCPCNGNHAQAERAHQREIMLRTAIHGNPFNDSTDPAPWTAPPTLS